MFTNTQKITRVFKSSIHQRQNCTVPIRFEQPSTSLKILHLIAAAPPALPPWAFLIHLKDHRSKHRAPQRPHCIHHFLILPGGVVKPDDRPTAAREFRAAPTDRTASIIRIFSGAMFMILCRKTKLCSITCAKRLPIAVHQRRFATIRQLAKFLHRLNHRLVAAD